MKTVEELEDEVTALSDERDDFKAEALEYAYELTDARQRLRESKERATALVARLEAAYGNLPPHSPFGSLLKLVRESLAAPGQ